MRRPIYGFADRTYLLLEISCRGSIGDTFIVIYTTWVNIVSLKNTFSQKMKEEFG